MDKPISVKDYVRELLDVQAKSYRSMIEMVVNEFREDLKALKKDVNDLKASIQFAQKDVDENKQKVSEIAVTIGQVHNAELAETAEPAEQDSSARLNSALFTGVLGKSP